MIQDIDANGDGEIDYRFSHFLFVKSSCIFQSEFTQMLFKGEYSSMYAVKHNSQTARSRTVDPTPAPAKSDGKKPSAAAPPSEAKQGT